MVTTASTPRLNAWFTVQGAFVGLSGVPVRLAPGQRIDPNAWYTVDGRRAAVAGPFRDEAMNRQGYLRGGQLIAAEKMQREANRAGGHASSAVAAPVAAPEASGITLLDWTSITVGSSGTAVSAREMSLVKTTREGLEVWHSPKTGRWYPVANQPNGITGPRNVIVEEASRFKVAGKVCYVLGVGISAYQGISAYYSTDKDRNKKMFKAGLDVAISTIGLLGGPIGFAIATIYFIVDTSIYLGTNGKSGILDIPDLMSPTGPGRPSQLSIHEAFLLAPADRTRLAPPRRVPPPRSLADRLRQTPVAAHNAVFRPASY